MKNRVIVLVACAALVGVGLPVLAAQAPVGRWQTIDDKTGKVVSEVDFYDQGGNLFGKMVGLTEPTDTAGKPKTCTECAGADKDKPIVGLVIIRDLAPAAGQYKGGTILDPEGGKVYKAEVWVEDGKLKVRGYLGVFYTTQTWQEGA